jgi:predicted RNA binding protein with dsRBD fold (UPF0201 family)
LTRKKSKDIRERVREEAYVYSLLEDAETLVQTFVYPCEDRDKVLEALNNIVSGEAVEKEAGDGYTLLIIRSRGSEPILRIFGHFRQRRVLATLRRYLNKYSDMDRGEIIMFLHKQAAYAGVMSLCEPGESPLGEIIVKIRVSELRRVIDWFTSF